MNKFRFGNKYEAYINRPNPKTIEEDVDKPKKYNGKVLEEFDDYEEEIVEHYKGKSDDVS